MSLSGLTSLNQEDDRDVSKCYESPFDEVHLRSHYFAAFALGGLPNNSSPQGTSVTGAHHSRPLMQRHATSFIPEARIVMLAASKDFQTCSDAS